MLSGDNGILQKATEAKENTGISQIQERINLAYHSALTSGLGKVEESNLKDEIKKEFNKTDSELEEENWLDKTSVAGKWRITIDGVYLDVPAGTQDDQNNGKISIKVGTTNLKEVSDLTTLYGETTDFTSVDNVQWQLFYDDDDNIYLIANDYVSNLVLPTEDNDGELKKTTLSSKTEYCSMFGIKNGTEYTSKIFNMTPYSNGTSSLTLASTSTSYSIVSNYLRWLERGIDTIATNKNMMAVAYMMDTEKWKNFKGTATGAYAIGGPTLELFIASYNRKHDKKIATYSTPINSTEASSSGYKVKWSIDETWATRITGLDTSDSGQTGEGNMWVRTSQSKAGSCYIASPNSYSSTSIVSIGSSGSIGYGNVWEMKSSRF